MILVLGAMAQEARAANPNGELEALIGGIAAGSREDLAELYRRTRAAVYGLALSYLKNGAEAEDVAQDTFVKVWAAAPSYRPQGKPMAWLLTIARNLALGRLRSAARIQDLSEAEWPAFPTRSATLWCCTRCAGSNTGRSPSFWIWRFPPCFPSITGP